MGPVPQRPHLLLFFFFTDVGRRQWHPTPVLLPGKSHGRRSLVGCSPWGRKESDTTERLHFHFSLSCIGEGNGNPLQCSCLENPRDWGAWWAAVSGVAQSWTRLKRLSSSSSSRSNLAAAAGSMLDLNWPGVELVPPALGTWCLNHWTAREILHLLFFITLFHPFEYISSCHFESLTTLIFL